MYVFAYIYILDVKMGLKSHFYSITSVTSKSWSSMLKSSSSIPDLWFSGLWCWSPNRRYRIPDAGAQTLDLRSSISKCLNPGNSIKISQNLIHKTSAKFYKIAASLLDDVDHFDAEGASRQLPAQEMSSPALDSVFGNLDSFCSFQEVIDVFWNFCRSRSQGPASFQVITKFQETTNTSRQL